MDFDSKKIIAEFMGMGDKITKTPNTFSWNDSPFYYCSSVTFEEVLNNMINYLKYDSSWNLLMGVVEKIETIDDGIYQVNILQEGCIIQKRCKNIISKTVIELPNDTTKIEAVFIACVEFIKMYNRQEQNKENDVLIKLK